jgi:hypothetical protein
MNRMNRQMMKDGLEIIGYVSVFASLTTLFAVIFSTVFVKSMSIILPHVL